MRVGVQVVVDFVGKESSYHERIANELGIDFYFMNPYSSWQGRINENTNGLIRQYIGKVSDLNDYTDEYIFRNHSTFKSSP